MSYVSVLEDIEKRAAENEHMRGAPVSALWLEERKALEAKRKVERQRRAELQAEADAATLERRTNTFVEGQLLWLDEIRDVTPLRRS